MIRRNSWMAAVVLLLTIGVSLEAVSEDRDAVINTFTGHSDWVRTLAFSPDGQMTASGGDDTEVLVWTYSQ